MLAFKVAALWLHDSSCCFQNYFLIICVSSRKETIGEHAFLPSMVLLFAGAYMCGSIPTATIGPETTF